MSFIRISYYYNGLIQKLWEGLSENMQAEKLKIRTFKTLRPKSWVAI